MVAAVTLAFLFGIPALLVWAEPRYKLIATISPVVLSYAAGILVALLPGLQVDVGLAGGVIAGTVLLAIPLLLFPSDLRRWLRLARSTVLSFLLAVLAVCVSATAVYLLLGERLPQAANVSGMLTGLYTGGTPNMNAVAMARGVDENTFILVNAADVILGSVYLLFLMTLARPLLARLLPAFVPADNAVNTDARVMQAPKQWQRAPLAVLLSLSLGALAAGASFVLLGKLSDAFIILGITTLAIACTASAKVRALPYSYDIGQYLLLVFCVAIGTQADLGKMLEAGSFLLLYATCVLVGAVLLHLLGAWLLRVDVDTAIITSTAAIYGPPFVGPIAKVLGNREVVVSGMTAGVFGLAIGNYLGYLIASALAAL